MSDEVKYFSIGEVSAETGIKQTVLRFWETEFDELHPKKNKFGHRVYIKQDIEIILKIKELLYERGMTIKGAKNAMHEPIKVDGSKKIRTDLLEILSILKKK